MLRNITLVTHPRSGTTWTGERASTLNKRMIEAGYKNPFVVRAQHMGFHPNDPIEGKKYHIGSKEVFTVLRDAQKVIVSTWFWLKKHTSQGIKRKNENYGHDLDFYVREIGVPKYLNFLRRLSTIKLKHVFYYEEIQTPDWYREFSEVFDLPLKPSPELCEAMHKENSRLVSQVGTDHSIATPEILSYIREHVSATEYEPYQYYIRLWEKINGTHSSD